MATEDVYRTKDGRAFFKFRFFTVDDYYEIDIVIMPGYGSRSTDPHTIHRVASDRGGYRICFENDYIVNSFKTARKWASAWAENTWDYIKYGTAFPNV